MLFPTITFAVFFLAVYVANWLTMPRPRLWRWTIIAASYVFYAWWDWRFVLLLVAATLGNQFFALRLAARPGRLWLTAAVAANLGVLGLFKYYDFFAASLDELLQTFGLGTSLPLLNLVLPVGISFLTFRMLTYVVDVYRSAMRPAPALDLAVYVCFFPYLLAGPIARARDFIPQLRGPADPHAVDAGRAFLLVLGGLAKKVVIADYLATHLVNGVFATPGSYSSWETLVGIYAYAVQIYCDFSAYSDIAIGVALLLGFKLPENFRAPYTAVSLQDFWRRWHITLSGWLRDYLYIPLGGNRKGRGRTYLNLLVTMLLGGLWHGAAWTFVFWGGLHGCGLVWERARADRRAALGLRPRADTAGARLLRRLAVFHFVAFAWVFFRADTIGGALAVLARLVTGLGGVGTAVTPAVLLLVAVGIGIQYVPRRLLDGTETTFSRAGWVLQGLALAVGLFLIDTLGAQGAAEFIYFGF